MRNWLWHEIRRLFGRLPMYDTTGEPKCRSFHVGINDHGGPDDLRGCVNDAKAIESTCRVYRKSETQLLLDSAADYKAFTNTMRELAAVSEPGDSAGIQFSSHGTRLPDVNGDEVDGYDEALVLYNSILTDDEMAMLLARFKPGVNVWVWADTCHSHTITRGAMRVSYRGLPFRPRYRPPLDEPFARMTLRRHGRVFNYDEGLVEVVFTGCEADGYSYDGWFGKPMGAMTYFGAQAIERNPSINWKQLYREVRRHLPSRNYNQTPTLEGSRRNTERRCIT